MTSWRRGLTLLLAETMVAGAHADAGLASAVPDDVPWTVVDSRGDVRDGGDTWKGADDLSFRHRERAVNGTLVVQVQVTDDVIVPGKDRVDLRLVDPRLADEQAQSAAAGRDALAEVAREAGTDDVMSRLVDDEARSEFRVARRLIAEGAARRFDRRFRPAEIAATPRGYEARFAVPLRGAIDLKTETLDAVGYRLEVTDVDAAGGREQARVMVTSRRFERVTLDPPLALALAPLDRMKTLLVPSGHFRADRGRYVYVGRGWRKVFTCIGGCGAGPIVSAPGPWEPVQARRLSHGGTVEIFVTGALGRASLYGEGDGACWWLRRRGRTALVSPLDVDASDHEVCERPYEYTVLSQQTVGDVDYVVARVWEMPSGGPVRCGAQADDLVVWLAIGPDLRVRRRQSVLTGSCDLSIDASVRLTDDRLEIRDESRTTVYDARHPARGLVEQEPPPDAGGAAPQ